MVLMGPGGSICGDGIRFESTPTNRHNGMVDILEDLVGTSQQRHRCNIPVKPLSILVFREI